MKKRLLIFLIVLLPASSYMANAQDGLSFAAGISSYAMEDMKLRQEQILQYFPYPGKISSSFPAYTSMYVAYNRYVNTKLRTSLFYGQAVTGAKSSYYDYSGYVINRFDMSSHRLGLGAAYRLLEAGKFESSVTGSLMANFTRAQIDTEVYVLGYYSTTAHTYRAVQPALKGGIEALCRLETISLGIEAGYLLDLPSGLKDKQSGEPFIDETDPGHQYVADWSGFSARLSILIWLDRSKQ